MLIVIFLFVTEYKLIQLSIKTLNKKYIVDLKSNSALLSNESHNLLIGAFPPNNVWINTFPFKKKKIILKQNFKFLFMPPSYVGRASRQLNTRHEQ